MVDAAYYAEVWLTSLLSHNPDWRIMRDVLIPSETGTCQIDFLNITNTCIFVGEIKTFHGMITGKGDSYHWKHYYSSGKYYEYYNPSFQNRKHVQCLRRFLSGVPFRLHYHSVIIMIGYDDAQLCLYPPYLPDTSIVGDVGAMERITNTICQKNLMQIDDAQIQYLFDYIGNHQIRGQEARAYHVGYVQNVKSQQQARLAQNLCPLCDGHLVLRKGQFGEFWGCSNYPRCRYTHNT